MKIKISKCGARLQRSDKTVEKEKVGCKSCSEKTTRRKYTLKKKSDSEKTGFPDKIISRGEKDGS